MEIASHFAPRMMNQASRFLVVLAATRDGVDL
jgi:hypothetical protein